MFRLIIFGIIMFWVFGILSFHNEKLVINTIKGKEIINKSSIIIKKNMYKGTAFIQKNVEVK